jgi:hypothetical protein
MNLYLIILFSLLLCYLALQFYYIHKREHDLHRKEKEIYTKSEQILTNTHKKSLKIVSGAVNKSKEILGQTKAFKNSIEYEANDVIYDSLQKYAEEIEKNCHDVSTAYEELFSQFKNEYIEYEKDKITKLESVAEKEISEFSKNIDAKTEQFEQALTQIVQTEGDVVGKMQTTAEEELKRISETITGKALNYELELETKLNEKLKAAEEEILKIRNAIDEIESTGEKGVEDLKKKIEEKTTEYQTLLAEKIKREIAEAQAEAEKYKESIAKIEEVGRQGVESISKIVTETTLACQEGLQTKINEEFDHAKGEIAKYKEEKLKAIDEEAEKIIKKLSIELLGKAIKIDEHEKILLDALEKAKKESILSI